MEEHSACSGLCDSPELCLSAVGSLQMSPLWEEIKKNKGSGQKMPDEVRMRVLSRSLCLPCGAGRLAELPAQALPGVGPPDPRWVIHQTYQRETRSSLRPAPSPAASRAVAALTDKLGINYCSVVFQMYQKCSSFIHVCSTGKLLYTK